MKKYYVIYFTSTGKYLQATMANTIAHNTTSIASAGKWESEEKAVEYADSLPDIKKLYFEITPVWVKH
jgi:hypothetical protein